MPSLDEIKATWPSSLAEINDQLREAEKMREKLEGTWGFIRLSLDQSCTQEDKRYFEGYISGLQMAEYLSLEEWRELEVRIINYRG